MALGRCYVSTTAKLVFRARQQCLLTIWAMPDVSKDETASQAYLEYSKELCRYDKATPIPVTTTIPIPLQTGQEIWAVSEDQALIGFAVGPLIGFGG